MAAWMAYAVLVALALSAAALAAERAAKIRGTATRWVWVATLAGSLMLPTVIASVSIRLPDAFRSGSTSTAIALRNTTSIHLPSALLDLGGAPSHEASATADTLIRDAWAAMSMLMMLALAATYLMLHRRKRGWNEEQLCGERVLVAHDAGPAVVGLIRARIVVPAWLLQADEEQQRCAIAHERSHLDARDPQLIALALLLLAAMPWNPLLWWQFIRLRRAIELDCDARVLRGGHDVGTYCETLIQVGQHQSSRIGVVPAMSDSVSFLESRIRHMLRRPGKWTRVSATALACVAVGMAAFAAQVTPPALSGNDALDRYAGFYQVSAISLVTVTRAGDRLTVSISGQIAAPKPFHATPLGENRFAVADQHAILSFSADDHGDVRSLVIYQNGRDVLDTVRVDRAAADRINAALAARIKAQKPFPGSEKALRLWLGDPDDGAGMSADLARRRADIKSSREKYLAELGPIESYVFKGVSAFGSDEYLIRHRNGTETALLILDEQGTLVSAYRYR